MRQFGVRADRRSARRFLGISSVPGFRWTKTATIYTHKNKRGRRSSGRRIIVCDGMLERFSGRRPASSLRFAADAAIDHVESSLAQHQTAEDARIERRKVTSLAPTLLLDAGPVPERSAASAAGHFDLLASSANEHPPELWRRNRLTSACCRWLIEGRTDIKRCDIATAIENDLTAQVGKLTNLPLFTARRGGACFRTESTRLRYGHQLRTPRPDFLQRVHERLSNDLRRFDTPHLP